MGFSFNSSIIQGQSGLFQDLLSKFSLKFKDLIRVSTIDLKFNDFKEFSKGVVAMWVLRH